MKQMKSVIRKIRAMMQKEQGGALVIALIIMLALTLLGLSLLLQSNTEYAISINERDSTAALYNAEAALQLAKARIQSYGPNLTDALDGPDPAVITDNGVISILTPSLTLTSQLNASNEHTQSAIVTLADNEIYEAFRIGVDNNGDTAWDGPRGLVYVRIEDNYDETTGINNEWADVDRRINAHVISQYPIRVDANGTELVDSSKTFHFRIAGVSTRQLIARFGTAGGQAAIVTHGDMDLGGSLEVCGACGSVHANQDLTVNGDDDFQICQNATETNDTPVVTGGTIGGNVQNAPRIDIEIANPYHEQFVPDYDLFDTVGDPELAGFPELECDPTDDVDGDGQVSKYFAFVGDGAEGLVYKARWDGTKWLWVLIDNLNDAVDVFLNNCGEVVLSTDPGAVDDDDPGGSPRNFYGFDYQDGGGSQPACDPAIDDTLGPSSVENDYVLASLMPASPPLPTGVLLPGSGPLDGTLAGDGIDFISANPRPVMNTNHHSWTISSNSVYSPLYNAVIFVYGNLGLTGGPDNLCSSVDQDPCPGRGLPNNVWRATFVSFNNITTSGGLKYAPFRRFEVTSEYQWLLVAGRDIRLGGNTNTGPICSGSCTNPPDGAAQAGLAGIVLAHEQLRFRGNVSINGLVKSEDAADCAPLETNPLGMDISGSVEVYYDCEHPPSTGTAGARMTSWEEVQ